MSTRSTNSKQHKTMAKSPRREASVQEFAPEVIKHSGSPSRLEAAYTDPRFKLSWDNAVRFHVSRHLLFLRRYRRMSQNALAVRVGTSQPAIARIEAGEENITENTLERMINALHGRLRVSIAPAELQLPDWPFQWWDVVNTGFCSAGAWTFQNAQSGLVGTTQHVKAIWSTQRHIGLPDPALNVLPAGAATYPAQAGDGEV